jgi:hypothetical protein
MASLRLVEIFDSLQGEGYWTGVPMTFVRLAGCNAAEVGLECVRWCDTPDSWTAESGEELGIPAILERVRLPRLCLTGGEPLLQAEGVAALVAQAQFRGVKVHLETNGTLPPPRSVSPPRSLLPPGPVTQSGPGMPPEPGTEPLFDWAVISPKPPDYFIAPEWEGLIDELKLVVDGQLNAATAERLAACHPGAIVSIQPLWEDLAPAESAGNQRSRPWTPVPAGLLPRNGRSGS